MTTHERAIAYAEDNRQNHRDWIRYWRTSPPRTREARLIRSRVGGIEHHRESVRQYDTIIKALRCSG